MGIGSFSVSVYALFTRNKEQKCTAETNHIQMLGESEYKLLFKSVMSLVLCCLLEKGSSINVNVSPACVNNFLFQEIHNKGE